MTRLFLSLYVFIAVTLIGLSAVLNHVFFANDASSDQLAETYQQQLIISSLALLHKNKLLTIDELSTQGLVARNIQPNDIPWSQQELNLLYSGNPVVLYGSQNTSNVYFMNNGQNIIEIDLPPLNAPEAGFYWYSLAFFVLLALGIMLWIWPLWRDLQILKRATEQVDISRPAKPVGLKSHSVVYPIAKALDDLNAKVRELVNTQSELTGAVAHEFRTPLARIKFALEALKTQAFGQQQGMQDNHQQAINVISEDILELETLMQEMLSYTSLDHQTPELNISSIPLIELVKQRVKALSVSNKKGLKVSVVGTANSILIDEHYISRAIDNLLNNALKHANRKIVLETKMHTIDHKEYLLLRIQDDGEGIPPEQYQRVFEPFFRPDQSRNRKMGGAGLGLAIVKRIANWHQARCWAEASNLGGASLCIAFLAEKA